MGAAEERLKLSFLIFLNFNTVLPKISGKALNFAEHLRPAMKPEKTQVVCPVCGSCNLYLEAGGYTGNLYRCKRCDYMGALVVEADGEMARAIREDYEKRGDEKGG